MAVSQICTRVPLFFHVSYISRELRQVARRASNSDESMTVMLYSSLERRPARLRQACYAFVRSFLLSRCSASGTSCEIVRPCLLLSIPVASLQDAQELFQMVMRLLGEEAALCLKNRDKRTGASKSGGTGGLLGLVDSTPKVGSCLCKSPHQPVHSPPCP